MGEYLRRLRVASGIFLSRVILNHLNAADLRQEIERLELVGTSAVPALMRLFRKLDQRQQERRYVADALGRIGDPRAVGILAEALPVAPERSYIALALLRIGSPDALQHLNNIIRDGITVSVRALRSAEEPLFFKAFDRHYGSSDGKMSIVRALADVRRNTGASTHCSARVS